MAVLGNMKRNYRKQQQDWNTYGIIGIDRSVRVHVPEYGGGEGGLMIVNKRFF